MSQNASVWDLDGVSVQVSHPVLTKKPRHAPLYPKSLMYGIIILMLICGIFHMFNIFDILILCLYCLTF